MQDREMGQKQRGQVFLAIFFAAAPLLLIFWLAPGSVELRDFEAEDITKLLTSLLVVTLFLERALEVFITTWRGPEAELYDLEIENCEDRISKLEKPEGQQNNEELKQMISKLEEMEKKRSGYRSDTKRIALWTGLAMGLLISGVGIRTLQTLVDPDALSALPRAQETFFHWVDVLLTGGLIAGGSEAIHKLTEVYSDFMESTSKRAKARGETD